MARSFPAAEVERAIARSRGPRIFERRAMGVPAVAAIAAFGAAPALLMVGAAEALLAAASAGVAGLAGVGVAHWGRERSSSRR